MFVHAPEKSEVTVRALVLWDDPDLASHAVGLCRDIERRLEEVEFCIEEADAANLEREGEAIRTKACVADLVIMALQQSLGELPGSLRNWLVEWSHARKRQAGALAVLRPADPVDEEQFRHLVHEPEAPSAPASEQEQELRQFLEDCANRAHMELFWGLSSELEEATRGMRILEAPESAA